MNLVRATRNSEGAAEKISSVDGDPVGVWLLVVAAALAVEHGNIVPLSRTINQTGPARKKRTRESSIELVVDAVA